MRIDKLRKLLRIRIRLVRNLAFADYCLRRSNKASYKKLFESKKIRVYPVSFIDKPIPKSVCVEAHEQYFALIDNATVIGGSNVVKSGKYLLYDLLQKGKYHITDVGLLSRDKCLIGKLLPKNLYFVRYFESGSRIDNCISLLGNFSWNYYHYIYEFIQKFYLIEAAKIPDTVPLLVDVVVRKIPQFLEILNLFKGKREVIYVDRLKTFKVNVLYYFSFVHQIPPNFFDITKVVSEDVYFDREGLLYLRERFLGCANKGNEAKDVPRKIFISRNVSKNRQYNEEEIIDVVKQNGFAIVYPERMSVVEQFFLFSQVDVIIAASGAALSNIICCKQQCRILVLVSNPWNLTIFSNIAGHIGATMLYLSGMPNDKDDVQSGFIIDKATFSKTIEKL